MSTWPKRESVSSTSRVTSAARVTSVGTASASGPSAAASAESRSPERAERTTRAPQRARAWAVARPMPELAPVTMATCPESGWLMVYCLLGHGGPGGLKGGAPRWEARPSC